MLINNMKIYNTLVKVSIQSDLQYSNTIKEITQIKAEINEIENRKAAKWFGGIISTTVLTSKKYTSSVNIKSGLTNLRTN